MDGVEGQHASVTTRITIEVVRDTTARHQSAGEGKCEWLATTPLPSTSNSINFDSIGWQMLLDHVVSVSVQGE